MDNLLFVSLIWLSCFLIQRIFSQFLFLDLLFNFPFTILHEICHFIIGIIFSAKPTSFSILPKIENNKIIYGSVGFMNLNVFNTAVTGLAPLLLFIPAYFLLEKFFICFYSENLLKAEIYGFIVVQLLNSAVPSREDLKIVFFRGIAGVLILILYFAGIMAVLLKIFK